MSAFVLNFDGDSAGYGASVGLAAVVEAAVAWVVTAAGTGGTTFVGSATLVELVVAAGLTSVLVRAITSALEALAGAAGAGPAAGTFSAGLVTGANSSIFNEDAAAGAFVAAAAVVTGA